MSLHEEFKTTGNWLFRWRSYLPLLMLIVMIIFMFYHYRYFLSSRVWDQYWGVFCLLISFLGLGVRIYTVGHAPLGTSGRNTKNQVADVLNTTGIYSILRHPLYLGNFFIWFGISTFIHVWWFSLICLLIYWLYYERIMFAEEAFLEEKFREDFIRWAQKTPAIIPNFSLWKASQLSFSLKYVLRKEYSGFFAIVAVFALLDLIGTYVVEGHLKPHALWLMIFFPTLMLYLVLRYLKKKTQFLSVDR